MITFSQHVPKKDKIGLSLYNRTFACTEVIVVKEVIANSLFGCIFSYKAYGFNFSNSFKFFNFPICNIYNNVYIF